MNSIKQILIKEKIFLYNLIPVVIVFLLTRLPYYLYYPVTGISFDTPSYLVVAFDMLDFKMPLFEIRTPGYPFFLFLIWSFSKSVVAVSLMQSIITLITSVIFLYIVSRYYERYIFLFSVVLTIYISSSYYMLLDTALLTESLFVNFLILSTAFLIAAFKKNKIQSWILFSVTAAVVIIVRPAGLFLVSIFFLIAVYFFVKKYKLKYFVSLLAPFTILLLSLCLYNYITLKSFTLTPFGESNLSGVVITFMEPSAEYPEYVNDAVNKVLETVPKKDLSSVRNSYEFSKLYRIFLDNYTKVIKLVDNIKNYDSTLTYTEIQPDIRRVYMDAIKNNPVIYLKFFGVNFIQFFRNISRSIIYFDEIAEGYNRTAVRKLYYNRLNEGGWQQVSSNVADYEKIKQFYSDDINRLKKIEHITVSENEKTILEPTMLKSVYEIYEKIYNLVFRNTVWLLLFIATLFISIYKLFKSRLSDIDAMIFFLIAVMFISKAAMVSLVEVSLERYSYTVEYAYYLSLPFLLIMLKDFKKYFVNKTSTINQ